MWNTKTRRAARVALVMLAAMLAAGSLHAQEEFKETFEAFAVVMGTSNPPIIPSGRSTTLQINITRWTTDEERNELLAQLVENGQEGLVKALQKQEETGWARAFGRGAAANPFPSERLRYARQFPKETGGRRIVLALDRYISFAEAVYRPRWRDYDVTLIVLDLDENDQGEGQVAMGVRLDLNPDTRQLTIENFGSEPVRLTRVRKR